MYVGSIPDMSPGDLEKVLKHLPEPTRAEVSLAGNFDYSDISRQAQEVVEGASLRTGQHIPIFVLEGASKERILQFYRTSQESYQRMFVDVKPTEQTGIPRIISLHEVVWLLDNNRVQIGLTPQGVNVKYSGQEPNYISQLRQELAGTTVRLEIEVNR